MTAASVTAAQVTQVVANVVHGINKVVSTESLSLCQQVLLVLDVSLDLVLRYPDRPASELWMLDRGVLEPDDHEVVVVLGALWAAEQVGASWRDCLLAVRMVELEVINSQRKIGYPVDKPWEIA